MDPQAVEGEMATSGREAIRERLREWRQAHPRATFDEIEDVVQQEMAHLQAELVDEVLQAGRVAGEPAGERPACPACGERMRPCGRRQREVLSRLGQPVQIERDYYVCPACGTGLFPPR